MYIYIYHSVDTHRERYCLSILLRPDAARARESFARTFHGPRKKERFSAARPSYARIGVIDAIHVASWRAKNCEIYALALRWRKRETAILLFHFGSRYTRSGERREFYSSFIRVFYTTPSRHFIIIIIISALMRTQRKKTKRKRCCNRCYAS